MVTRKDIRLIEVDLHDDAGLERWLAVRNAVDPRPLTVAGHRAEMTAAAEHLQLLATLDGVDAGAGAAGWGAILAEMRIAYFEAWVLPDARRRGVGTALIDRSIVFARHFGMVTGRSATQDGDAGSLAFAARYGLQPVGGGQLGFLDLTPDHAATVPDDRADIRIATFVDRPDLERAVYDLDVLVQPEVPALAASATPSFDAWQAQTSGDPGFVPALSLVALRGEQVVGALQVYDNAEGTAFIGMTAVHPDARRQGIARALKTELSRRAAHAGWRRIETFNDGTNDRMRALNIDLGYAYLPAMVSLKGPLPTK